MVLCNNIMLTVGILVNSLMMNNMVRVSMRIVRGTHTRGNGHTM